MCDNMFPFVVVNVSMLVLYCPMFDAHLSICSCKVQCVNAMPVCVLADYPVVPNTKNHITS